MKGYSYRYKTYETNKRFTVLLQKDFFSFEMLARICKAMTFSRCLKYKWKGNRWSVAIVAAEKSSAFEHPVIHYIHVINANVGRAAFLSLYNVCYNLRNETSSSGHATSHDARRALLVACTSSHSFFSRAAFWFCFDAPLWKA